MKQTTAMSGMLQYDLILFKKLGNDNRKDKKILLSWHYILVTNRVCLCVCICVSVSLCVVGGTLIVR